jgi:hypothetical protein
MTAKIDGFLDEVRRLPRFVAAGSPIALSAAAPEIEVTPAMIEAGVEAFCAFDRFYDTRAEIVAGVFRAMEAARSSPGDLEKSPKAGR